ncbi:MAG: hypothetical protein ACPG19_05005 [Saprospiraceae bacterium]
MLDTFRQLLIDNDLMFEAPIKNLDKSSCNSKKVVIDFDKVKDTFRNKHGLNPTPKSADALLLEDKKLIFIEMKDLTKVIEKLNENITRATKRKIILTFL